MKFLLNKERGFFLLGELVCLALGSALLVSSLVAYSNYLRIRNYCLEQGKALSAAHFALASGEENMAIPKNMQVQLLRKPTAMQGIAIVEVQVRNKNGRLINNVLLMERER